MNNKNISGGELNGLGQGIVNVNSLEFKELQKQILAKSQEQSEEQILENKLLSLRFQIEAYLESNDERLIEAGWFLREYIRSLGIKSKVFAEYIGFKESNLSALYKGKRKINIDLALKLGQIFKVSPSLWIHIQTKNELMRVQRENEEKYHKYKLNDLIQKRLIK